jgi:hypothetical protein
MEFLLSVEDSYIVNFLAAERLLGRLRGSLLCRFFYLLFGGRGGNFFLLLLFVLIGWLWWFIFSSNVF